MRKKPERVRTPESIAKQKHTMAQKKLNNTPKNSDFIPHPKKYKKKPRRVSLVEVAPDLYLLKILG